MKQTIESVWKEGFLDKEALIAPKINDLYNQKSQHIVDKLKRMFKINLIAIAVGATALLIASFFSSVPYIGIILFLMLSWLVIFGQKEAIKMVDIDQSQDSYSYLKSIDIWLKNVMASYTKIYRFFYPLILMATCTAIWLISMDTIIDAFPGIYLINNIPVFWLLAASFLAVLSGVFAGTIYKWDMQIMYGNIFDKLDEIINDMEKLRA